MAVAIAKRRWPELKIDSVGTSTFEERAAKLAIDTIMARYGIDIADHRPRPISAVDLNRYDHIIALDKSAKRTLIDTYGLAQSRVVEMYVDDPYGDGPFEYDECAKRISHALGKLHL